MKVVLTTCLGIEGGPDHFRPDAMSPSMQKFYRRTVQRFSARPATGAEAMAMIVPKLMARIIVNGREFEHAGQMPPSDRRIYEETLAQALPVERAIEMVARVEHGNFVKRACTLGFIAAGLGATIVYLWLHGYYA